jgi:hypothetical protein
MAAECAILLLKTLYVIARYSIHLWDINQESIQMGYPWGISKVSLRPAMPNHSTPCGVPPL